MEPLGGPPRVLVVDDEPTIRDLVADVLSLEGYEVDRAADGQDALTQARAARPRAIVLDLMMPGMDGWTFAERCAADPACRDVPIIVMSAARELGEAAERLRPFGVRACVAKPFEVDALVALVERYAGRVADSVPASVRQDLGCQHVGAWSREPGGWAWRCAEHRITLGPGVPAE